MTTVEKQLIGQNELWWLSEGAGSHGPGPRHADVVVEALKGAFSFVEESNGQPGLRSPQLGALHAMLAHRSTEGVDPITVVMPTGTGKTETMLAAFAHSPVRTLVLVPSDALRTQIAGKFATLGVLPSCGAVSGDFLCPVLLIVKHGLSTEDDVDAAVQQANVVIATAQALDKWTGPARKRLAQLCHRLFVDEAHHVAAATWRSVTELFQGKETVQFTATPYREDGQILGGRLAYDYPLRLAQQRGYFAPINYHSVVAPADPDHGLAVAAIDQLHSDLAAGRDHILMARASSVARAKEILSLYETLAPELGPLRIDTGYAESTRLKHREALFNRDCRIAVCVNMLGEGFDLPALKVAAIHDPQKSLAATLQFIGRFTRVGGDSLGAASAFVPLQVAGIDDRLRKLYGEDADWNQVIRDLTEHEVGRERERTEFEVAFGSLPREIALRSIHPTMSTVTYRASGSFEWEPDRLYDLFEGRLLTTRLGINDRDKVVWWVTREATPVRWGDFASFNELVHHLYVVHVDDSRGFLYINSTNNASMHEEIAKVVGGEEVTLLRGETIYRILATVQRRVPKNVGLLDAVSRARRFSMHVGQDVLYAWRGEGGTKMKTNIFAHGFAEGRPVSFGASRKGRVWSHEQARDIHDWVRWAEKVGPAITDTSVSLDSVMSGFLLPEPATERPPYVPLAIEWPHELGVTANEYRQIRFNGSTVSLLDTDLMLDDHAIVGPLTFSVTSSEWSVHYQFEFREDEPPLIRAVGEDAEIVTTQSAGSLAAFLTLHGLLVTFEDEVILVEQGFILRPDREQRLYPNESIEVVDWAGIALNKESQGAERDPTSIQYRAIEALSAEADWEVIVDDDGKGELADIVLMRRDGEVLEVLLAHCKYSSKPTPGARIDDFYDVCGQAMKMNRAKSLPELLTRKLYRRETDRQADGRTGIVHGSVQVLAAITREARYRDLRTTVAIIQPGLSRAKVGEDIRALLGATERFLSDTYGTKLRVMSSK